MKVCPTILVSGIGYSAVTNPITTFFENKRFSSFLANGPRTFINLRAVY